MTSHTNAMSDEPTTSYARSGNLNIAYQVFGDGPIDLVYAPGFISHVEMNWELPYWASIFRRLSQFSRVIMFDKRGTGCTIGPEPGPPSRSEWMTSER